MRKKAIAYLLVIGLAASLMAGCGDKKPDTANDNTEVMTEDNTEVENAEASDQDNKEETTEEKNEETAAEDNENKAVEIPSVSKEEQLLASLVGQWQGDFMYGSTASTANLNVTPEGEYKLKLLFGADGWTHSEYSGKIEIFSIGDNLVASFKIDTTDDNNFSNLESAGDYYIDGIREDSSGVIGLYLTQANNGISIIDYYFNSVRPVLCSVANPYEGEDAASYYEIKSPSDEYYYLGSEKAQNTFKLDTVSIVENDITDDYEWFSEIGIPQPDYYWMDDTYIYCKSNVVNYEYTQLDVYNNLSDNGDAELLYSFNMSDFQTAGGYTAETAYANFVTQGIKYALISDGVIYISTGHRTYTESCPQTGYITAIDIETGKVLWKTQPGVCNSQSFDIAHNKIICGYGFTAEPDYLNVIDLETGELVSQYNVKNAVEYVVYQDNYVFVRTYSYNYVYCLLENE